MSMPKTVTTVDTISRSPPIPPAISYRLSDKSYLDAGWTAQPLTIKKEQLAVTMKAKFSHPVICPWFKEREKDSLARYLSGKTLYLAKANGTGRVYYPNGKVAIEIKKGGYQKTLTRVFVYSDGEVGADGLKHPAKFCALFDSLGNGIIYDHSMNRKLVYNQNEGMFYGSPNGAPVKWKWHNIRGNTFSNDERFKDNKNSEVVDSCKMDKKMESIDSESLDASDKPKPEVELRNRIDHLGYVNTARVVPREVAPVKPIVVPLNKHIAFRIFDQSHISLSFYADGHHTHFRIGILYNPFDKLFVTKLETPPTDGEVLCSHEAVPPESPTPTY